MQSFLRSRPLLLLVSFLQASSVAARSIQVRDTTPQPLNPPSFDNWVYLGCYSDSQSSRTLATPAHFGEHVDDDNCVYQCIQLGYIYAGVEYSGQCYCGNYVNPVATKEPESDCFMPCTKTSTQACGGPDRMNLYFLSTATPAALPAAPTTNPGPDGWVSQGCYSDNVGYRTLGHQVDTPGGGSAMTVALCVDACHAAGYVLAGVEYGGQCFCDNTYTNGGPFPDNSKCNMACNGGATEFCGGPGAMNLYSYQGATPTSSSVDSSTPTPVSTVALPAAWATLGCYTDNVGARALSHPMNVPSMTVEKCVSSCAAAGYTIAGVEYGSECYCDNTLQNNQGQAPDGSAGCNMPCSGNGGETCGGPGRINVYAAGPSWVSLGCYSDQPYARTLTTAGTYSGQLTIQKCLDTCKGLGFAYAGLEYSTECFCGARFENSGGVAPDGNAGCNMPCAGDGSEICGGSQRLSMYEYINADGTLPSPPASGSSGPSSTPLNLPSGWSSQGCWVDLAHGRILANQQPDSTSNTIETCIATCSGLGYSIAGLEYSSQCFCDNFIQNQGALASSNSACQMQCSGNTAEICGGPALVSVYSTSAPQAATVPTV